MVNIKVFKMLQPSLIIGVYHFGSWFYEQEMVSFSYC